MNLLTPVVDDLRAISRKWGHKNEVMINMQKFAVPSIEHTPTQYGLLSMRSYGFRREEGVIAAKRKKLGNFRSHEYPRKRKSYAETWAIFQLLARDKVQGKKN